MLAIFSRTGMFYPSAEELALTLNCKCTLKIPGTRIEMSINTNNWKEHFTACFSVSTRQGHWVAFRSGGGPPRRILAVWLNPVWVSLYPPCLHCSPSGTWLSVPPPSPPHPPQGTSKVSWTSAQINVTSDPAGVVSGPAGQRGDKPVFVQQKLRVVLYLKRAIITSVAGVLTGRRSCRGAVHHGNARPRNRWPSSWTRFFFFLASVRTACTWPIVSGLMGVASSWLVQTAPTSSFVLIKKKERSLAYFRKANEIS